ncbi:MAG: T9SS type A sorting domain-containing protein [Flavobacteriales bacterium]
MKKLLLFFLCIPFVKVVNSQCDTTNVSGNLIQQSSILMGGVYIVNGTFHLKPGATVYVEPYSFSSCGKLIIIADKIIIEGTINGDYAGYPGGPGGAGGSLVTSLTGDITALNDCSNKDESGQVTLQGGQPGLPGQGPGAGNPGLAGGNGSGPKQQCQNNNDESGLIGGGGGAGGGAGGSYAGHAGTGGSGGSGSNSGTTSNLNVSPAFVVIAGSGGTGGASTSAIGTISGADIHSGSGGAGGGGGGRSYNLGTQGGRGGNGGALIQLIAQTDSLIVTGNISSKGENGLAGGNGGSGDASPKCCSDGCDDCGEATLSCGAGAGSGGGGGSGGGIWLETSGKAVINGNLNVSGGNGGAGGNKGTGADCSYGGNLFCSANSLTSGDGNNGNEGGGGSAGRIKIVLPLCADGSVNPVNTISGGTGANTGATGSYAVVCSAVGIDENSPSFSFILFPNPTEDDLNVRFSISTESEDVFVAITDVTGRMFYSSTNYLVDQDQINISVSDLPSGYYLVSVVGQNNRFVKPFIKK